MAILRPCRVVASARPAVVAFVAPTAACTSDGRGVVGPVWVVEDIAGAGVIDDSHLTLVLGIDGQATGRGGCNRYGGSYRLDGAAIRFDPLAATKRACAEALMNQEQRYFEALADRFFISLPRRDAQAAGARAGSDTEFSSKKQTCRPFILAGYACPTPRTCGS